MSKNDFSRRDVLRGSALAVMGIATGGASALAAEVRTEAEPEQGHLITDQVAGQLRFGIIGCGGKGSSGMAYAAEHGPIVAVADVDAKNRNKAIELHPRASAFDDYRDMLRAMKGKIDAVVISTPDHHHGPASAMAMKMGLHCYTEKPLCRTIWEARQLQEIARKMKVATQMGNQSTASTPMRKVAALIKKGHFGKVKEIYLWTDRAKGWWPQGVDRPAPGTVPAELDFDTWLGPRPVRPYAKVYHPFSWRGWWDFGTGSLGDMGCHIFNMPFMALDLRDPVSVQAQTSGHNRDSFPEWVVVDYEFGERNGRAPVKLRWHDGGKRPDASLVPGFELGGNGVIVVCEKATIYGEDESNTKFHIVGGGEFPDIMVDEAPGSQDDKGRAHMAEFVRAAMGGKPAASNFPNYSGPLAETVLLGNLAIWANGPKLEWDAKNMKVKGTDEFDSLIRPTFKAGFGI